VILSSGGGGPGAIEWPPENSGHGAVETTHAGEDSSLQDGRLLGKGGGDELMRLV